MSSSTVTETSDNLNDEIKSPSKINAFQFMMNSRHKVIGSNSPGKDKKDVETKSPEVTEKSKEKLNKRKATFENWAEKKGGTKRKLADEAAEKHISKTLHKRAKRLKKMLAIIDEELKNSGEECSDTDEVVTKVKIRKHRVPRIVDSDNSSNADDINGNNEANTEEKQNQIKSRKSSKAKEENVNENDEQLKEETGNENKKKSFKDDGNSDNDSKVIKENTEVSSSEINEESNSEDKENNKVLNKETEPDSTKKCKNERNKKKKKKSLSLRKSGDLDERSTVSKDNNEKSDHYLTDEDIFPKSKEEKSLLSPKTPQKLINDSNLNKKKNEDTKKECFTPRTWRMKLKVIENNDDTNENKESGDKIEENNKECENNESDIENKESESIIIVDESPQKEVSKAEAESGSETKKPLKIAPIFLRQQQKKLDKEALSAKKNFLRSGVPSKVKKLMTKSKSFQESEYVLNIFPKISHIQQKDADESSNLFWNLPNTTLSLKEIESNTKLLFNQIKIGSFTDCTSLDIHTNIQRHHAPPLKYKNVKEIVKEIKQQHPSYPVYKTFRLLYQKYEKYTRIQKTETKIEETPKFETPAKKRGRPKKKKSPEKPVKIESAKLEQETVQPRHEMQMWTEKYRPQSQEEIIGNAKSVQDLKSWLESWIKYSEDRKSSRKRRLSSSSDDFCSDSTSKDSDHLPQNLILLFGPLGSGKTSSIYGLCNELSINVIEINASSKRPGKKILADLQEATQSHQVKNTDSKSVTSFFQKKPDSQTEEDVNKKLSLLLFEDVDIVFEDQDESFISALSTLIISSKRPIILTSTDSKCPHLQKFVIQYTTINFNSLPSRILCPWLQILCLIEGVKADKDMIDSLIQWNKGDVRKTILQLQFWTQTGGDPQSKLEDSCTKIANYTKSNEDICVDDESPDMLWITEDNCETENKNSNICHQNCAESFIPFFERDKEGFKLSYPINLENIWWNVPEILGKTTNNFLLNRSISNTKHVMEQDIVEAESTNLKTTEKSSFEELNAAVNFLDSLAIADIIHTSLKTEYYDEPIYNYWHVNPANSLSLNQNFRMHNEANITSLEISHWMVENTAKQCEILRANKSISQDINTAVPYFPELSWRSTRHKTMKELLNAIPILSILDRKAICEDYQTILRTISRTENERSITNSKRKNRFYHYLKNFNIHLNDSAYLLLCNTLAENNLE